MVKAAKLSNKVGPVQKRSALLLVFWRVWLGVDVADAECLTDPVEGF